MSCSPEIILFVEDCEKRERRKKFIIDEERSYRLRTSSPISQETSETPDLEECDDNNSRGIPDGIVKWNGEYRGRASGDIYSEEEILHAQREGLVLWMMTVAQGHGGYYREEVWFSKGRDQEEYWSSEVEGYICCPGWMSLEEYLEETEESYPDEVKEKAAEIMDNAVWLPNVSEQTRKGGKFKVPGHWSQTGSKHTGFISWEEDGETYYVCNAKKDSSEYGKLLWATDKAPQYPKLTKEKGQLLGKILLNYFAPWL